MSSYREPFVMKKIHAWLTVGVLLLTIFSSLFGGVRYAFGIENKVTTHTESTDLHMTYKEKVKEFVPRTEVEGMKESMEAMREDIKFIRELLMQN